MKNHILPAVILTGLFLVFFCVIYPAVIFGIAQLAPNQGKGEIIEKNGQKIGFARIGQNFTQDDYFNSRPSAVNYNAAGSAGSNKGTSNPDYLAVVQARIDTFLVHNPGIKKSEIPSELVTASGSGLDPHLSVQACLIQIPRIAKVRKISEEKLKTIVAEKTEKPLLSFLGTETVNVLQLNLSLDELK
ncbi:MAG: K(+)-transporting ATPase subunit C [Verrucomicrobia bacterium]|nr:K(+)-transporting ATPase subunit C [Cytophagales bacterium]